MPLISRRDLISSGVAASATAILPNKLLSFSGELEHSELHSVSVGDGDQIVTTDNSAYSTAQRAKMLDLAEQTLTKLFAGKMLPELLTDDADLLDLPSAERVHITLRHAGRIRGSVSAPGPNLGRQIVDSVYDAAMDQSYGGHLTRGEASDTILELWIQIGSSEVNPSTRNEGNFLILGIEGMEIESNGKVTYYIPSIPITSKYKTETALFGALCVKAGLEREAWLQPNVRVRKTQWLCLPSIRNTTFFGREPDTDTGVPIPLDSSIQESASYLIRNQDASGRTAYLYDPIANLFVGKRTNLIRSAGCLFALSQVLESNHRIAREAAFKACTMKMARGLLRLTSLSDDGERTLQEDEAEKISAHEKIGEMYGDEAKDSEVLEEETHAGGLPSIGATALLAAALSGQTLRKEFAQEYSQLYRSIVSAQKADGRFVTYFGEAQESERAANFYPGEALLVLAMEAERKNTDALERCRRAFQPYMQQFRSTPTSAFIVWHLNVWSRIAFLTGEHTYADFCFEQADWLLQIQIQSHHDSRWVGGFSQSSAAPQIYSVAFTEAIVRALALATKVGDTRRSRRYVDSVRSGLRFCNLLRLEQTQATLFGNPLRCKGGVAFSLTDRRIRCDSVQHFITLCLAVEQIKDRLL